MQLSKANLKEVTGQPGLDIPAGSLLELPEKVLQFGTGVLLRGLPDYFIDKANKKGIFNGRVVVVKSTAKGDTDAFEKQDSLYTLCVRGKEGGVNVEETIINASISRVLAATDEWAAVLQCAHNPAMKLIVSNTTEVGIAPSDDAITLSPPPSYPGKLLAFLYERYKAFGGSRESGLVIIPTELVTDNGNKLRSIVTDLAAKNKLDNGFLEWLQSSNHFCNSLVDRIVPGKLAAGDAKEVEQKLGYTDELMIMSESFRLWAIETADESVKEVLSFSQVDEGVVVAPNIEKFRELKLRLLNGTHTFSCGLALLAGFETVKEAMNDAQFSAFVRRLMTLEIAKALDSDLISYDEACVFAGKVMDRFSNPFLEHKWISIAMNFTSKMRMRNIPLLQQYYAATGKLPAQMALGFAAYLVFMNGVPGSKGYQRKINDRTFVIEDESAAYYAAKWAAGNVDSVVDSILADLDLWGTDLTALPGFAQQVKENIRLIQKEGVMAVIGRGHLQTIA